MTNYYQWFCLNIMFTNKFIHCKPVLATEFILQSMNFLCTHPVSSAIFANYKYVYREEKKNNLNKSTKNYPRKYYISFGKAEKTRTLI